MPDGIYDKAVIAQGLHLLPFRTEKLNLVTSMVLPTRESRKPPPYKDSNSYSSGLFFIVISFDLSFEYQIDKCIAVKV